MDQALSQPPDRQEGLQQPQQPPVLPQQPIVPPVPPQPVPTVPMAVNWSHFKHELSCKSEEDPEADLLRTIDWIDMHNFVGDQRVRRVPLTSAGEARLLYQTIHPFQGNWKELQDIFRTQPSKIGNKREQLFHVWRSFDCNKNAETIDTYVQRIRPKACMLNNEEPQISKVFKHSALTFVLGIIPS